MGEVSNQKIRHMYVIGLAYFFFADPVKKLLEVAHDYSYNMGLSQKKNYKKCLYYFSLRQGLKNVSDTIKILSWHCVVSPTLTSLVTYITHSIV